jgi:hypothetical protein
VEEEEEGVHTFAINPDVSRVVAKEIADRLVAIAKVTVTNSRQKTILVISPNEYPATRFVPKRESPDDPPVEFVQVYCHEPSHNIANRSRILIHPLRCHPPSSSDFRAMTN